MHHYYPLLSPRWQTYSLLPARFNACGRYHGAQFCDGCLRVNLWLNGGSLPSGATRMLPARCRLYRLPATYAYSLPAPSADTTYYPSSAAWSAANRRPLYGSATTPAQRWQTIRSARLALRQAGI